MNSKRKKPVVSASHSSASSASGVFAAGAAHCSRTARRVGLLALSLCLAVATSCPVAAYADTEDDLEDAKARYEEVQEQLDGIAEEYAELSKKQSDTLDEIEAVQKDIEEKQAEVDERQEDLSRHQEQLANFAVETYKQDSTEFIDVLLSSDSFSSFVTNLEYIALINETKLGLISDVREAKADLEEQKASLEEDEAQLQELRAEQASQMQAMQAKQQEVTETLADLDEEVQELTEKYNEELAARAAEAAAAAAAAESSGSGSSSGSSWSTPATLVVTGSGSQSDVISACYSTPSPGANWCAAWVSNVFMNAGFGFYSGNACDMYNNYCYSSDRDELEPGMIVAVSSNPRGGTAGTIYGHVGIYIGNNTVMENIGYIAQTDLDDWIDWYSSAVTPRWGWIGGVVLS